MEEKITIEYYRVPGSVTLSRKGPTPDGAVIRYRRRGKRDAFNRFGRYPQTKGGITVVIIENDLGRFRGIANCSVTDNFCYQQGRSLAQMRARIAEELVREAQNETQS